MTIQDTVATRPLDQTAVAAFARQLRGELIRPAMPTTTRPAKSTTA